MDACTGFFVALAMVLLGDLIVLLNAPRLVKHKMPDPAASGGEVKANANPVMVLRLAIGVSMIVVIAIFVFLLSENGCLA